MPGRPTSNRVCHVANAAQAKQFLWGERLQHFLLAYMIGCYLTCLFVITVTPHGRVPWSNPLLWIFVAASPFLVPVLPLIAEVTRANLPGLSICCCLGISTTAIFILLRAKFSHAVAIPGRCVACSYDLTTNTSRVCPECGTPVDMLLHQQQLSLRARQMPVVWVARLADGKTALTANTMRVATIEFLNVVSARGVGAVRVWCSWNPDLPEDSPLQSPQAVLPPGRVAEFLDSAVRNGVWKYADPWNRAGIDAIDGSFTFLLGNDRDIRLNTDDQSVLEGARAAWVRAGYIVRGG